jgi:hypothetical protein
MSKMDRNFDFSRPYNKLGRCHVNLYFLFYLVCSPKKSHMRPEAHVQFRSQASAIMPRLRLTNTSLLKSLSPQKSIIAYAVYIDILLYV